MTPPDFEAQARELLAQTCDLDERLVPALFEIAVTAVATALASAYEAGKAAGAESMREKAAAMVDAAGRPSLARDLRALPLTEPSS